MDTNSSNKDLVDRVIEDIDRDAQTIQDFTVQMLRINATNSRMGGPGEIERANYIQKFLENEGLEVSRVEVPDDSIPGKVRPNLFARIEGKDTSRTLWYVGHMDTVPEGSRELWNSDPFEPVVRDGKIIARGAEDNGQSMVGTIFAIRELKRIGASLPFNLEVVCVSDEEFGSDYGVKYLIEKGYFKKSDLMLVPDSGSPSGTEIEVAEKGLLWLKITTKGKQVHASLPSHGLNAHRVGVRLQIALDDYLHKKYVRRNSLFHEETKSTFELTKVDANVPNVNTIPGVDAFYMDCRVLPEYSLDRVLKDIKSILKKFGKKYKVKITLEIVQRDDAGPATSKDSEIATLVKRGLKLVTGKKEKIVGIGGQTVGNLFRLEGIPTVAWGTADDVAHQPNEYCWIKNLISDTKVFAVIPLIAERT